MGRKISNGVLEQKKLWEGRVPYRKREPEGPQREEKKEAIRKSFT